MANPHTVQVLDYDYILVCQHCAPAAQAYYQGKGYPEDYVVIAYGYPGHRPQCEWKRHG